MRENARILFFALFNGGRGVGAGNGGLKGYGGTGSEATNVSATTEGDVEITSQSGSDGQDGQDGPFVLA